MQEPSLDRTSDEEVVQSDDFEMHHTLVVKSEEEEDVDLNDMPEKHDVDYGDSNTSIDLAGSDAQEEKQPELRAESSGDAPESAVQEETLEPEFVLSSSQFKSSPEKEKEQDGAQSESQNVHQLTSAPLEHKKSKKKKKKSSSHTNSLQDTRSTKESKSKR